ncbi:MAG: hypothetical protein K5978_03240 [Campylobacter sp.]|nr:hypothetical protein [Campylobacter sp.]
MQKQTKIQPFTILGGGVALPKKEILAKDLDEKLNLPKGSIQKAGANKRFFISKNETTDLLIQTAVSKALNLANLRLDEIECIIDASASMRQAIPFNAANVCRVLGLSGIPAFDVNMTCLGALQAMSLASNLFNEYKYILILCCEIASVGLDKQDLHSFALFGDGATALIVSPSKSGGILNKNFAVYPNGYDYCQIQGGGWACHPIHFPKETLLSDYVQYTQFHMDGKRLYKLTADVMPDFLEKNLKSINLSLSDIDFIVPHQASRGALKHLSAKLHIKPEKIINIFEQYGNQIAASLPHALIYLLNNKTLKGGDKILLVGTSAGLGLGMLVWEIPQEFINFKSK